MVNEGYLWEFVLSLELPLEVRVLRQPEAAAEHLGSTLVQCREVNTIFGNFPIEGTTTIERTLYVNEGRRDSYPVIDGPVFFSEEDSYVVHVPHDDALIVTAHIRSCKVL